jgi:hypothetical protein
MEEYRTAARQAGLREESIVEISHRVEYFWAMTHALIQAEAQTKQLTSTHAPIQVEKQGNHLPLSKQRSSPKRSRPMLW